MCASNAASTTHTASCMAGVLYEFVTVMGAEDQPIARTSTLEGGVWFPSEALYAIASREPPSTTHTHT